MDAQARRTELQGWIAQTNRLQRKLAVIYGALFIVVIGLAIWKATVGGFAFLALVLVAVSSFWVTAAHNAAHRQKLDELMRTKRNRSNAT